MILLIENNLKSAESIGDFLSTQNIEIDFAFNGVSGFELASKNKYEVIIMNIELTKLNGLTLCHKIRNELFISTPIIFVSDKDDIQDKIAAFSAGADDFIVSPLSYDELHCRVKALSLRGPRRDIGQQTVAKLKIDYNLRTVTCNDTTVKLHFLQMNILKVLVQHYPNTVSRRMLEQEIWGEESPASAPLRTHIYRLRIALEKPFQQPVIDTVYGQGYHLVHPF